MKMTTFRVYNTHAILHTSERPVRCVRLFKLISVFNIQSQSEDHVCANTVVSVNSSENTTTSAESVILSFTYSNIL